MPFTRMETPYKGTEFGKEKNGDIDRPILLIVCLFKSPVRHLRDVDIWMVRSRNSHQGRV